LARLAIIGVIPYFEAPTIGPIQPWGFFVASGVLFGIWLATKRTREQGLDPDHFANLAACILLPAFLCARLMHVFGYHWAYYQHHLGEIWRLWEGGMSSYGGFLGAALGGVTYLVRSRMGFWHYADIASYGFIPGWTIGRVGCFVIHDHPGKVSDFILAAEMRVMPIGTLQSVVQARHDLGLYDGILSGLIWLGFLYADRRKRFHGFYLGTMCVAYAVPRFFLDFLRASDLSMADTRYVGLTPAQYGSIILLGLGGWILWTRRTAT